MHFALGKAPETPGFPSKAPGETTADPGIFRRL